jgi:hypothetical protein
LHRPQDHRHVAELVVLSFERQFVRCEALQDQLEGLVIDFAGIGEVEAVGLGLERDTPRPTPSSSRPPLIWSSMQISSIRRSG